MRLPFALTAGDVSILFSTRILRMFAYGVLSVILVLYLSLAGLSDTRIGLLLTATLIGDTVVSLLITVFADRIGKKVMLIVGCFLMFFAGLFFAVTNNFSFLLIAGIIGVISPSGNEVGPFLAIEQAALAQVVPSTERTRMFAWYNLAGYFATALGALSVGAFVHVLQSRGVPAFVTYRTVILGYAFAGMALALLFLRLSRTVEVAIAPGRSVAHHRELLFGLHRSRTVVFKLSALFSLDAFAGGFIMQSIVAYWFHVKFGVGAAALGSVLFAANLIAGFSALAASRIAARIGLVRTMVVTHLPSNILLLLVPVMPTFALAVTVLLLRFTISQMDVPTRQSYTMAVVSEDERSAAAGITGIARTTGAALGPVCTGSLLASPALMSIPFFIAGTLKIIYDLLLYRSFRSVNPL